MALSSLKRLDQKWLSIKNIFQKINILTTKNTAKNKGEKTEHGGAFIFQSLLSMKWRKITRVRSLIKNSSIELLEPNNFCIL